MIYKVLYQENKEEVPVRERTKSAYLEADSVREARKKIGNRKYNIEYIHALDEAHLDYEKQSENFTVENV
ncbi:hypothetical protein CIL05_08230 [Virgibacillus profundi]|uniref:DNA-directed RNA polymerase subunit epsilon n=1 Tax=Virgibacillus profundi TaxID=2024555 RepID=A0A2A2IDZ8_9BACI|nr:DNA-directed RNA polymerase subunit epsilon [Virgibacillus profundi]PAV29857.1 hypothetical protein CIL05_08230 [Virgibacillus profundi]PXY54029.1 hypothetical protein CIT14_08315 [Virgibacillus profundi]